jgi:hypothetical protein
MDFVETGLVTSFCATLLLVALFAIESRRGTRFLSRTRLYSDYFVIRLIRALRSSVRYVAVHVVRQVGHYSFHVLLASMLALMTRGERAVRNIMRTNKTLAKTAERDRVTRSKLEEIALHKMETALSDEERAIHKERALNG